MTRVLLLGEPAQTDAYLYKCTNAMTGDFPLIIGFVFNLFLYKQYAFRTLGIWNELSWNNFKFVKRLDNLLNRQMQAFIIFYLIMSSFVISINKVAKFGFRAASG